MWKFEKFVYEERLNSWDEEFAILVYKDIDGFLNEKSNHCCVLIFPPLNNRRRYLIHKLGELFNVHTFSVGEGVRRVTVVCPFEKIEKQVDEEKKVMDKIGSKKGAISKAKRARPDAPIYIPPAIRKLQKTPQLEKNETTHKSSKNDTRQKNIEKPISSLTELCNTTTFETPQKSEAEDYINIKVDTSDLCTRQLGAEQQIKCESTVSVQKENENNVPDKNVIKITSASEISTALQSVETHLDTCGHIVPNYSENITEDLKNNSQIVENGENNVKINSESISKDNQNVEINIKCPSPNPNTKSNEENEAHNNGNGEKEIGENENNLSPNPNTKSNEENEALNNGNEKEIGENENNLSPNPNTKSKEENEALNNGNDKKEIWENENNLCKDNDQEQEELLRASEEINRKNKRIIKQSFNNSNILIISNDNNKNSNTVQSTEKDAPVDCWEDLLEGGELDSELMLEIIDQVGKVNISKAKEDYSEYKQKTSLEGDHAHVLEIYDFPKEFTTRDLVSILDSHKAGIYHIKWVDDNHALGVFTSGFVATEMLKIEHPLIKLRPMTEASKQSISKAIRYPNAMLPTAVRPQTCAQAARRMVSGALGLKLINAKEERAKEIKILKEAREKKKLSAKQQDDAWEGKPSSN